MPQLYQVFPVSLFNVRSDQPEDDYLTQDALHRWWDHQWTVREEHEQAHTEHLPHAKVEACVLAERAGVPYAVSSITASRPDAVRNLPAYLVFQPGALEFVASPTMDDEERRRIGNDRYLAAIRSHAEMLCADLVEWMDQDDALANAISSVEGTGHDPVYHRWKIGCDLTEKRTALAQWLALSWRDLPDLDAYSETVYLPREITEAIA